MFNFYSIIIMAGLLATTQLAIASPGEILGKDGVVHGYVVDATTHKPVSGVVVSAASAKTGISREVATNADGYFKFKQLPAGDLSIQFDKKGYHNIRKEPVALKEGMVLKMNIDFISEKTAVESPVELDHPVLRLVDGIW
ncbi:carboxypeptidase-like regulatory domain-containing protein [Flavihumibacter profundi]|uniref:carboxypeptidase-like regulatory domain-containing protein n=1 Tax=Flavihumibacter profundi TaxID=2716883 RepID=UPI001CC72E19|nr:carboxypeptidase-like regulatory domain-containing protein [Flavihumibacter profundi]MBZ5858293.1 carboxypeptidase-like regulatory domain-containing protein [Flavihumibacter profundi]